MASYAVHRLIQNLCRRGDLVGRLKTEPDAVFTDFGIGEAERAALRNPNPETLGAIGVHPILQVHLMLALDPGFGAKVNLGPYAERLKEL
jgi:2'-aminobiphenyl-2,3-diol 1,2-dioxygenase small subunit